MLLGTAVETALGNLGITVATVEVWLGKPCGCAERRDKLDALHFWAKRVITGHTENAKEYLSRLLSNE